MSSVRLRVIQATRFPKPPVLLHIGTTKSPALFTATPLSSTEDDEHNYSLSFADDSYVIEVPDDNSTVLLTCSSATGQLVGIVRIPKSRLDDAQVQQWYPLQDTELIECEGAAIQLVVALLHDPTPKFEALRKRVTAHSTASSTGGGGGAAAADAVEEMLPTRLADYFIVAGASPDARMERYKLLSKPRKTKRDAVAPVQAAAEDARPAPTEALVVLDASLRDRYPTTDTPDVEFPIEAERFLLPDGVEVVQHNPGSPRFFTFVHRPGGSGCSMYGFCLEVYEPVPKAFPSDDDLWAPTVLCFLTRLPLEGFFRKCLEAVRMAGARTEACVVAICNRVPMPIPGSVRIKLTLLPDTPALSLSLPPLGDFAPLVFPGLVGHLLTWFGVGPTIDLWAAALTGRKTLIHSTNRAVLALVAESVVALMYPFQWESGYVPVLPSSLLTLLETPVPCIFGLKTDTVKTVSDATLVEWVVVDADRCVIKFPVGEGDWGAVPKLETGIARRLHRMLTKIVKSPRGPNDDRQVRMAFLEALAAMLQGYGECLFVLNDDSSPIFNKVQFLLRRADKVGSDDGAEFLSRMFETQHFERFKVSQDAPELALFHAAYNARRTRERERDQRLAALAALEPAAEEDEGGKAQWSARGLRWSDKGVEPMEVAVGKRTARDQVVDLVVASPVEATGNYVTTAFGPGVLLAKTDGRATVLLDWGATAYIDQACLVAPPPMPAANFAPLSSYRLATSEAAMDPVPVSALSASDAQFQRQLSQDLWRMKTTGMSAGASLRSRSAKSAGEREIERALSKAMTHVFFDRAMPAAELGECATHLNESQHARDMLVLILSSQQQAGLSAPGRGRRLGRAAFGSLTGIVDALLKACAFREDYSNGRQALHVSRLFFRDDPPHETVQSRLVGSPLWKSLMFWEFAFAEDLAGDRPNADGSAAEPPASELPSSTRIASLWARGKRRADEDENEYAKNFFELLSGMLHTMLSLEVGEDKVRALVARVVQEYSLSEEQDKDLNILVTNFVKAVQFTQEELGSASAEPTAADRNPTGSQRSGGAASSGASTAATSSRTSTGPRKLRFYSLFKQKVHLTGNDGSSDRDTTSSR